MIVVGVIIMFSGGSLGIAGKGCGGLGCDRRAWHWLHHVNGQQPAFLHPFSNFGKLYATIVCTIGCKGLEMAWQLLRAVKRFTAIGGR